MQSTRFGNMSIKTGLIDMLIWQNSTKLEQLNCRGIFDSSVVISVLETTIFFDAMKKVIPDRFQSNHQKNHNFLGFQIAQVKQYVVLRFENSGFGWLHLCL